MMGHLPVLQVVTPLMAAPLAALVRRRGLAWLVTLAAMWASLAISVLLLLRVLDEGTIIYSLGGWAAPWGIEYRVDTISGFVLVVVSGIGAIVAPYAMLSVRREVGVKQAPLLYSALLLCLTGLLGITITGDIFNLFVFLEVSSISAYALIAMGPDRRALHAAYKYLIIGSIGATFIVIGIGMLYMLTGTLNMADLAERLPDAQGRTVSVAFAFLTVGISLKLALFPLHQWLPDAYTYAPSTVTVFLASTATKVAVYVLLRVFFTVFGVVYSWETMALDRTLGPLALLAILSASLMAIYQNNVKRLLAYSSVAQIGYMILGVSLVSVTGLTAGILHLFNHALIKATLFMAMGAVMYQVGSVRIEAISGLGRRMPWTMAAFIAGGLSLIGVPLTVGFVSKWFLVLAAVETGLWAVAALVLVGSILAVVYVWKVVEAAYFGDYIGTLDIKEAPLSLLIPIWVLVAANFYFGIDAETTAGVSRRAAEMLLGISP
jgi:multicomponent Na+:H+ antiporter subunit D